jgi:predicted small lipoprotein YifL
MKRLILLALLILVSAAACGKKGDLRAPELAAPQPINNLSARPAPDGVTLTWNRPTEYIDGKEIKDLASFVIFRKELSPSCVDCPVPYRQLRIVNVEDREKFVKQKQYRYDDLEVRAKAVYRYRVSAQLFDGSLSAPSNEVEITR